MRCLIGGLAVAYSGRPLSGGLHRLHRGRGAADAADTPPPRAPAAGARLRQQQQQLGGPSPAPSLMSLSSQAGEPGAQQYAGPMVTSDDNLKVLALPDCGVLALCGTCSCMQCSDRLGNLAASRPA